MVLDCRFDVEIGDSKTSICFALQLELEFQPTSNCQDVLRVDSGE